MLVWAVQVVELPKKMLRRRGKYKTLPEHSIFFIKYEHELYSQMEEMRRTMVKKKEQLLRMYGVLMVIAVISNFGQYGS